MKKGFPPFGKTTMLSRRGWIGVLVLLHIKVTISEAAFKDGSLEIQENDVFTIDTSNLTAAKNSEPEVKLEERNGTVNISGHDYPYSVAELKYKGDIKFHKKSKVIIKGSRSLSIQSSHGDISIATNISMTCSEAPKVGDTCLGGYMVNRTACDDDFTFSGLGPGGGLHYSCEFQSNECNDGAGHGGKGRRHESRKDKVGMTYGKTDFNSLIGGSAGNADTNNTDSFGGGAIEIKAENGSISIDAVISASSANGDPSKVFSGASGGLIRLVADKVEMTKMASLKVDGGNGSTKTFKESNEPGSGNGGGGGVQNGNGGGGGGLIQIVARQRKLYNLSLAAGESFKCVTSTNLAGPGCLVTKENMSMVNVTEYCNETIPSLIENWQEVSFPATVPAKEVPTLTASPATEVSFPATPAKEVPTLTASPATEVPTPTASPTTGYNLSSILKEIITIKMEFNKQINNSYFSTIFNILQNLQNICQNKLNEQQLLTVLEIFYNFIDIVEMLSQKFTEKAKEIYGVLLRIANFVISSHNQVNWKKTGKMAAFVQTLEDMAVNIANITTDYHNFTDLIAVQSKTLQVRKEDHTYTFPVLSELPQNFLATEDNFVSLPKKALPKPTGNFKVVVLIFKNIQDGLPEYKQTSTSSSPHKVASLLTSYNLLHKGDRIKDLKSPAYLNFKLYKEGDQENPECMFWNKSNELWDKEGLSIEKTSTKNKTVCKTLHFTSFAVLMQFTKTELTGGEKLSLLMITYIGCAVSIGVLFVAAIIFITMEALSSERHRIHLNLVIAMLLAQVLFLISMKATKIELLCKIMAGGVHYFYLASFCWMLIEGVHLYLKVVKVFGVENVKLKHYCVIGWVVPILIIAVAAIIAPNKYGTKYVCWLSLEDGFVWAFIGPVLAIIFINCIILGIVIKTVVASASTTRCSDHSHVKAGVKSAVVLVPLMGITWIFGLLAVNRATIVFQYIFAITNSLQGFLIFLLHIVFNNEVRTAFRRQREKRQLSKEATDYNASYTSTNESDRKSHQEQKKRPSSQSSNFNSNTKSGFERLKERLSMSKMQKASRVISVQPFKSKSDEDFLNVERKFQNKNTPNRLSPPEQDHEMSSLNCPMSFETRNPPLHSRINSRQQPDK